MHRRRRASATPRGRRTPPSALTQLPTGAPRRALIRVVHIAPSPPPISTMLPPARPGRAAIWRAHGYNSSLTPGHCSLDGLVTLTLLSWKQFAAGYRLRQARAVVELVQARWPTSCAPKRIDALCEPLRSSGDAVGDPVHLSAPAQLPRGMRNR